MKSLMRRIDRFCLTHPRFGISNLMLYVVIGNAVVFLFSLMDTTGLLLYYLAFIPSQILRGQVWRLFTFALIPNARGLWILLFLYFYYFIGSALEREWGRGKFTIYFFSGILFTVLYGFLIYLITGRDLAVGASYIYLSMFFSFATFYPEQQVLLFFFIPVKIKWLAWADAAFFLLGVITSSFPENLLPVVAVLNYLLFCGETLFAPLSAQRFRQRKKTLDFKREAARVNAQRASAPYRFKCAVCGRTDVTNPELEFRYCSRCAGYHCFCQDHINSHIHFTE